MAMGGENVREPVAAGRFYPGGAKELRGMIEKYLDQAKPELSGRPIALISPHAGYVYSGQAAAYGFKLLKGSGIKRVIVLGLAHGYPLRVASVPSYTAYRTPLGDVPVDAKLREALASFTRTVDAADRGEHSIEVQLPFLQVVLDDFTFLPVQVGQLPPDEADKLAAALQKLLDDKTAIVVSSDFTHYGANYDYFPASVRKNTVKEDLRKLDLKAAAFIEKLDYAGFETFLRETEDTICGANPIRVLLRALPKESQGKVLCYYTSGDIVNDWDSSVSYFSIAFTVKGGREK